MSVDPDYVDPAVLRRSAEVSDAGAVPGRPRVRWVEPGDAAGIQVVSTVVRVGGSVLTSARTPGVQVTVGGSAGVRTA